MSFGATVNRDVNKRTTHVIANKERRTKKVRLAARYPNIKIVNKNWLLDCFSQWTRLDEEEYRIDVEPDQNKDVVSFSEMDGAVSSTDTDEEAVIPHPLTTENLPEPSAEDMHADADADADSPIDGMEDADWEAMRAEMDEFLNESDSETEGAYESDSSKRGGATGLRGGAGTGARKRTRSERSTDDDSEVPSSELQKRKKVALGRTSGLANVERTSKTPTPAPEVKADRNKDGVVAEPEEYDEDQDGDSELERELERQMTGEF